jgi:methylated-DNA-protein-cysteine methyltransferase related protein
VNARRRAADPDATADEERTVFENAVVSVLDGLRPGEVVTYGEVAAEAGYPGAARAVGSYLARRGNGHPWWRVVTTAGRLVPGHEAEHARRLRTEGVRIVRGHVVWPGATGATSP